MTWLHQRHTPGSLRIWLRRRTSGAPWQCKCDTIFRLRRRHMGDALCGYSFWEWQAVA